jgi:hypothetical protein
LILWNSSVGTVTELQAGGPRSYISIPNGGKTFFFTTAFKLVLGPIKHHIQWLRWRLSCPCA